MLHENHGTLLITLYGISILNNLTIFNFDYNSKLYDISKLNNLISLNVQDNYKIYNVNYLILLTT